MDRRIDQSESGAAELISSIFKTPAKPLARGAWLWWFWLFFIHDENTKKTGRCRQIMILWSVKNDPDITCNGMRIRNSRIVADGQNFILDGAAAAWYFDGYEMHEGGDFVLERSGMKLSPKSRRLDAPGATPSSFSYSNGEYITKIKTGSHEFELRAKKTDPHPAVGPNHGHTPLFGSMEIEGTRLEILELGGCERNGTGGAGGKKKDGGKNSGRPHLKRIEGTAYFQKILLAAPPPQWYWGLYHFDDGSFATYMQVYAGRAALAHNLYGKPNLRKPSLSIKEDILVYHAPSGRVFEGNRLMVKPSKSDVAGCWKHQFVGGGKDFEVSGTAEGYAHACWTFEKNIGILPLRSTFKYNEYPAVLKKLEIRPTNKGEKSIILKNGVGNMENSWGFLI